MFVDGFVALCSAVGSGAATEMTGAGYARQAVSFAAPKFGIAKSARAFTFGVGASPSGGSGAPLAGYAIYDAPLAGNLLMTLPFASPRPWPSAGPIAQCDVGELVIFLTALAAFPDGSAFSGTFTAGATLGYCYDAAAVIGAYSGGGFSDNTITVIPQPGNLQLAVHAAPLVAGTGLTIARGVLRSSNVAA